MVLITALIWGFFAHGILCQDLSPCDYKTITQPIDHFGAINGTFQQRYSYFDEFYKPGGPIMFFEGEETNLDCAVRYLIEFENVHLELYLTIAYERTRQ
jgi:hypothetical protein